MAAVSQAHEQKPLQDQKIYMVHCKSKLKIPFDGGSNDALNMTMPLPSDF